MRKFIIFAPPYNEKQGGTICLHKLVDLLNRKGFEAYIYPSFENIVLNRKNLTVPLLKLAREFLRAIIKFKVNKNLNTPIFRGPSKLLWTNEWVVVYGEQISGNPLKARNVVRWLLHQPGYHTGEINYGFNELHIKFNEAIRDFHYPNSRLADFTMPIIHYPLELYNEAGASSERAGIAYCIRKGKGKPIEHELRDSILIDNLSHKEISKIFKRAEIFISYDTYTAYSRFAALCGCDSVVIPDKNITKEKWYPNPSDSYGVAYGLQDIYNARKTRPLLQKKITQEIEASLQIVERFANYADSYFNEPRYNLFRKKHAE